MDPLATRSWPELRELIYGGPAAPMQRHAEPASPVKAASLIAVAHHVAAAKS